MSFFRRTAAICLSTLLIWSQPALALAEDSPEAPTPPPAPTQEIQAPAPPEPPKSEERPEAPPAPTAPPTPVPPNREEGLEQLKASQASAPTQQPTLSPPSASSSPTVVNTPSPSSQSSSNGGTTQGTSQSASSGPTTSPTGTGTTQTQSIQTTRSNSVAQANSATTGNSVANATTTGGNTASINVGDSAVVTGDANSSATILTAVNTNVAGVAVSEFNVVDNHTGDIILDFSNTEPLASTATTDPSIQGNGAGSQSASDVETLTQNNTFQHNDAQVENSVQLSANSGDNTSSLNTGGDSAIVTGDANVAANVVTFANNNVAGDVLFGVVNIYGNLNGDIIVPETLLHPTGIPAQETDSSQVIADNGADSENSVASNEVTDQATFQSNDASIENEIVLDANTGENQSSYNTGGNNIVQTGMSNITASTVTVANNNIESDTPVWLVIINEAGKWIGKIIGLPEGQTLASSDGLNVSTEDSGTVIVTDNGAGSTNIVEENTEQSNTADIKNTINLTANTGGNKANYNTGGNSTIQTGDTNVIANLVNFVNNNIAGGTKLVVTLVNVFGSWTGNFVPPGKQKEATPQPVAYTPLRTATPPPRTPTPAPRVVRTVRVLSATPAPVPAVQYVNNSPSSNLISSVPKVPTKKQSNILGTQTSSPTLSSNLIASTDINAFRPSTLEPEQTKEKILKINLAWSLAAIPVGVLFAVRKIFFHA